MEFGSAEHLEIFACSKQIRDELYNKLMMLISKYQTNIPEKLELFETMQPFQYHVMIDNFLWDYRHGNDQRLMKNVLFHNVETSLDV